MQASRGCYRLDLAVNLGFVNPDLIIGKNRFAQVLKSAIDKVCSPFCIKSGFSKCGIVPLNPNCINSTQLQPTVVGHKPGPGGDNTPTHPGEYDPLCDSCGQFVHGNPLVLQGIIPKDLADVFIPPLGPVKKKTSCRIVTKSRVITGAEFCEQLQQKETNKKKPSKTTNNTSEKGDAQIQPKPKGKKTNNTSAKVDAQVKQKPKGKKISTLKNQLDQEKIQQNVELSEDDTGSDDLPKLLPPKRARKERKEKVLDVEVVHIEETMAAIMYTCAICKIRGWESDEDKGITWVGCDNSQCLNWYHQHCLDAHQQACVDLSIIDSSSWFCLACSESEEVDLDSADMKGNNLICQVCLVDQVHVTPQEHQLYWATCGNWGCKKSYHQACLPTNMNQKLNRCLFAGSVWDCGQCPA